MTGLVIVLTIANVILLSAMVVVLIRIQSLMKLARAFLLKMQIDFGEFHKQAGQGNKRILRLLSGIILVLAGDTNFGERVKEIFPDEER